MNSARRTHRRAVGSLAAATTAGALLSGCSLFSEQTTLTQADYTPSDGVQGELGDGIALRNLIILAETTDGPGTMVGAVANSGTEDATVRISGETQGLELSVDVPAGQTVLIGPDQDESLDIDSVGVVPGRYLTVTAESGTDTMELDVPVLDSSLPEYADLVPTPSATL